LKNTTATAGGIKSFRKKFQLIAKDILFPVPPALVVSGLHEKNNIITFAWIGII